MTNLSLFDDLNADDEVIEEPEQTSEKIDSARKIADFTVKQGLPYGAKKKYAAKRAREFYDDPRVDGNVCVSVGGLDSITLYVFLRSIGIDPIPVSVSGLEDASIQRVHLALGVKRLKPYMSKIQVIKEFGFPACSKAAVSLAERSKETGVEFTAAARNVAQGLLKSTRRSENRKNPNKTTVWLDDDTREWLDNQAYLWGISSGEVVRMILHEVMARAWRADEGIGPYGEEKAAPEMAVSEAAE